MKTISAWDDSDIIAYFNGNNGKFLIVGGPTCTKCHKLVKDIENEDNEFDIGLYVYKGDNTIGANIIQNLEIKSVPALLYFDAKTNKVETLINITSIDEVNGFVKERI